ncbi:MAG: flagellar hook-associated protein FlgK [Ruminococcus sp.]|nr:flagellar hook-associated protein FlgK [Ruminococcus sp.]
MSLRPSFMGIESMKQTLFSAQKSLDITGNNISNVNTVGYSRQRADQVSVSVISESLYFNTSTDLAGQGTATSGVTQLRDQILDQRYREVNSGTALSGTCYDTLKDIENILDVIDTSGFNGVYQKFCDAISQFGTDNSDRGEIANVTMEYAKQMCQALKNYDTQLNQIQDQIATQAETAVEEVNTILNNIAQLNEQLKNGYVSFGDITVDHSYEAGYMANDTYGPLELKDKINELVDQLSTYGNVRTSNEPDGTFTVEFAGTVAVQGERAKDYYVDYDKNDGSMGIYYKPDTKVNASAGELASGELRAYLDMYNGAGCYAAELGSGYDGMSNGIAYYKGMIDALANTMATAFNEACEAKEGDMFAKSGEPLDRFTAKNIVVSDEWKKDPSLITYGPEGKDGMEMEELNPRYVYKVMSVIDKDLEFKRFDGGNIDQSGMTIDDFITYESDKLAQDISYCESVYDAYDTMAVTLANQRDSVMGVSLDEEGANMMTYQKWYNAAARMMTALDEALDTIINGMGLVGR